MLRKLGSRVAAWAIYHIFIFISRRVPFSTFTAIWNEAYQAKVEADWMRLKKQSLSTRLKLEEWVDVPEVQLSEQRLERISLKPGLDAGQGGKLDRRVIH